jgi:hypothetical protein
MTSIPADAPRSPDGHWWYDGHEWQPVNPQQQQSGGQAKQAGGLQLNESGVPLRGDGTPFPDDPSEWSEEERHYLLAYYFGSPAPQFQWSPTMAEVVPVPAMPGEGEGGA